MEFVAELSLRKHIYTIMQALHVNFRALFEHCSHIKKVGSRRKTTLDLLKCHSQHASLEDYTKHPGAERFATVTKVHRQGRGADHIRIAISSSTASCCSVDGCRWNTDIDQVDRLQSSRLR